MTERITFAEPMDPERWDPAVPALTAVERASIIWAGCAAAQAMTVPATELRWGVCRAKRCGRHGVIFTGGRCGLCWAIRG